MKKICILLVVLLATAVHATAQLEVAKILGKRGKPYNLGYGVFLKLGVPINAQNTVSVEWAPKFFFAKAGDGDGIGLIPVIASYRHVFNESGAGIYLEPQIGYNYYKDVSGNGDGPFKGLIWGAGTGYLSPKLGSIRLNPGIRFESVAGAGGTISYLAFRFAVNFSFGNSE